MHQHSVIPSMGGNGKKTLRSYLMGLGLSLLLTLVAFALVGTRALPPTGLYVVLSLCAVLQLLAQVIYFLRMNAGQEGRWNLMPFLFTIVIVGIVVIGTLWIMVNMNYNMMH